MRERGAGEGDEEGWAHGEVAGWLPAAVVVDLCCVDGVRLRWGRLGRLDWGLAFRVGALVLSISLSINLTPSW